MNVLKPHISLCWNLTFPYVKVSILCCDKAVLHFVKHLVGVQKSSGFGLPGSSATKCVVALLKISTVQHLQMLKLHLQQLLFRHYSLQIPTWNSDFNLTLVCRNVKCQNWIHSPGLLTAGVSLSNDMLLLFVACDLVFMLMSFKWLNRSKHKMMWNDRQPDVQSRVCSGEENSAGPGVLRNFCVLNKLGIPYFTFSLK